MPVDKNKEYTIEELESLIYRAANAFHGGGNLQNTELLYIAIPTILVKRLLDAREDMVEKYITPIVRDDNVSYSEALIDGMPDIPSIFHTKAEKEPWFFITYQDVINYTGDNGNEVEILCGPDKDIIITTTARNKIELWEEVCNSFQEEIIGSIFKNARYFTLYMEEKLTPDEANNLLNNFSEYHFGLNITTDMFSHVYIYIISKFAEGAGKKGGEFFTPDILCDLVVRCLQPELNSRGETRICDITSGSGTFLISMANYIRDRYKNEYDFNTIKDALHIYMQEKEQMTLMLGIVGLLMTGFDNITSYRANTLLNYMENIGLNAPVYDNDGNTTGGMDYFVGNPPYGAQILQSDDYDLIRGAEQNEDRWRKWGVPAKSLLEWFFVQTDIELLNNNGRGGLILPTGVLHKDSSRGRMLDMDIIEGVIVLPDKMFQTTSIQTCVVFFNKNKKDVDKNKVFMIDASKMAKKVGKYNTINVDEIVDIYINRNEIEDISISVDVDQMKKRNDSIAPSRYLVTDEEDEDIDIDAVEKELYEIAMETYHYYHPEKKES